MKPMKINYQSDFKLNEVSESVDLSTPFKFSYYTTSFSSNRITASFDGENYTNCRRLEDGSLLVIFDNHRLGVGRLAVRREYFLTDSDFADGICNSVSEEEINVYLTQGKSDSDGDVTVMVYPTYQQGIQGVTFTPSVTEEGDISWTNNGGLENPESVNIQGPQGDKGTTELMSFEIKDDGNLYVTQPDESNIKFSINENGELVASWN